MKLVILLFMLLALNPHVYAHEVEANLEFKIGVRYSITAGDDEVERNKQFAVLEAWRQAEERCNEQNLVAEEIEPTEPLSYPIADTYHMVEGKFLCR